MALIEIEIEPVDVRDIVIQREARDPDSPTDQLNPGPTTRSEAVLDVAAGMKQARVDTGALIRRISPAATPA